MSGLSPGTVVDRYRVEAAIGAGSMGDVVRGIDVDLKRTVAIKILSERHRDNEELHARFIREGRAVAAISHPNVVQVFTTGTFDDRPYIAMEFLRGVDLGTVVREQGTMTSLQAARAIADAARGLEGAATAGLIHRDVKPSNLVLLETGIVKVTDFGLAKPLDPGAEPALTAMGVVVGTPDYIAPEQARGEAIDERVDIYALGGTLYYVLTAKPPFRTGNPSEDKYLKVVARHLKEPAPDPRFSNRTADDELSELMLRMMAKKADDRPGYRELIEQLDGIAHRLAGTSAPYQVVDAEKSEPIPAPTPFVGGTSRLPPELAGQVPADASDSELFESARTNLRVPEQKGTRQRRAGTRVQRKSNWLLGITVVAVLVFLGGVGLLIFGPKRGGSSGGATGGENKETKPEQKAESKGEAPTPPEGWALIEGKDGWLFCDKTPVTLEEYADRFPKKRNKSRNRRENRRPVFSVSFADAVKYAAAAGGRLPSPEEWASCGAADGFEFPEAETWEWVDDGTVGAQAPRPVRSPEKQSERSPGAHGDVTFRVVTEPKSGTTPK